MKNTSGIIPFRFNVLVKLEELEEKTKGGIILPSDILDKENAASQVATIIDIAKGAFCDDMAPDEFMPKPQVGAKILIEKYQGVRVKGVDEEEYIILQDKQILAILTN
uniref:Co-chaperonin GroES n=1 Tax=uncultured virus TaxID=340016 RepID=A0A221S4C1_9VIRU|nr:co-chaperonin GroES [uncultured virus]